MSSEELIAGGAIRLFGAEGNRLRSRSAWNEHELWRAAYDGLADGPDFVAETYLGEQYRVDGGRVVRWNIETGDTEPTGLGWDDWLAAVHDDPASEAPVWLLRDWERRHRVLEPHEHLAPKQPFVMGGEFVDGNLYAIESVANLRWNAQLARQLRNVADGEDVRISLRWED